MSTAVLLFVHATSIQRVCVPSRAKTVFSNLIVHRNLDWYRVERDDVRDRFELIELIVRDGTNGLGLSDASEEAMPRPAPIRVCRKQLNLVVKYHILLNVCETCTISRSSYTAAMKYIRPVWLTHSGEKKDFEVYSCHVSPDGKRLVTAAGGDWCPPCDL